MKTLRIVKLLEHPYVCKITVIPLGLFFSKKHDVLFLYTYAMTYYFCCMGHGFILMEALPHIAVLVTSSQYLAASLQSGGFATYIYLFWWPSHNICIW